jgi:hypothetical protein
MPCAVTEKTDAMEDLLFTLVTVGFFAVAWLYARACGGL